MGTVRDSPAAVALDGKVFVVGGFDGSNLATAEVYDPAQNLWSPIASMGTTRFCLAAVAL